MALPFAKAQAVGNDFLIVEWSAVEAAGLGEDDIGPLAERLCDRHRGVGADGVEYVYDSETATARIRLFNSDASEAELSGNGTRCVAAWLVTQHGAGGHLEIDTAAGVKTLELLSRDGPDCLFDMAMGVPEYSAQDLQAELELSKGKQRAVVLNVGNPQCAVFVPHFGLDWRALGREIERHPRFPKRTNVSFIRTLDEHRIEVRFWERGAGETMSSGTGSTGAAAAAILTGRAQSPVTVVTQAGEMQLRWDDQIYLRGPATVVARGEYLGVV